MNTISFPGLGLKFNVSEIAFKIGGYGIAWYGILIASALLIALLYGMKRAKTFNITVDDLCDVVIFSIILGIIGARLYYVLFFVDSTGVNPYFSDPLSIFNIRNGGLGIYGGIIASFATAFVVCRIKKISVGAVFDIASLGFLIGQAIGRWGNFINQEAYGSATNLPWRMLVSTSADPVHPCFLYESLWCILGFILLHIYSKHRKFNGEVFLMYISWYAFGRFFIEGLRSDSLMLGNLKVSQLVAAIFFVAAVSMLIYKRINLKKVVADQIADYNPLFDETAKAVETDTAAAADEYEFGDDSDTDVESVKASKPEQTEDGNGENTGDEQ